MESNWRMGIVDYELTGIGINFAATLLVPTPPRVAVAAMTTGRDFFYWDVLESGLPEPSPRWILAIRINVTGERFPFGNAVFPD